jgi:hypothetical protein
MKEVFKWLLPIYILGYIILDKFSSRDTVRHYMLGTIILFLILVIMKYMHLFTKPRDENYKQELFQFIFSLVVSILCLCVYFLP